ncbi:MAG TPA: RHS repeat-associated core domain-containing protein, partial [Candidatus Brocadiaceae bacterium]
MDSLTYKYYAGTNQLRQVRDSVNANNYAVDIDNQSDTSNYVYDAIGNLILDKAEGIDSIKWNVYGKITDIYKHDSTVISYTYDASGNRISKTVIPPSGGGGAVTWYVRDATGNVMSVYWLKEDTVRQDELHMYGSSRLGIIKPERFLTLSTQYGDTSGTLSLLGTWKGRVFTRGKKFFELSNHLGNVLVTITDRKQQVPKNDTLLKYYEPDVATANDYYPFGMLQPGRKYSAAGTGYRYGFNGKENDNEVKGEGNSQDYGMRIYDPRLGRFLSVDPIAKDYPALTPYQFASNRPIDGIDLDGKEYMKNEKSVYLLGQFKNYKADGKYDMSDLWIISKDIHDIVMGVPNPPQNDDDSEPKKAKITELKGNQNNSKKQVAMQKREFRNALRDLKGDAIGLILETVTGTYSLLYRIKYDKEILYGSRSIHALFYAQVLLTKAVNSKDFPTELDGFKTDLVNYLTDGTITDIARSDIIITWGNLIYKNKEAILGDQYNFSEQQYVKKTISPSDGNTGVKKETVGLKEGNPDPDLKEAREKLKKIPPKEPPKLSSGG